MFLGAFVLMGLLFILVLEVHIGGGKDDFDDFDDDITMDLNLKLNDQRDMIAAAEKTRHEEQSEEINKVDNLTDIPPEILDAIKFTPDEMDEDELLEEEKESAPDTFPYRFADYEDTSHTDSPARGLTVLCAAA